jgi:hypothetical protein
MMRLDLYVHHDIRICQGISAYSSGDTVSPDFSEYFQGFEEPLSRLGIQIEMKLILTNIS